MGEQQLPIATVAGASAVTAEAPGVLAGILRSMVLNAVVPVMLYAISKRYISPSEYTALVLATLFPVGVSLWGLARRRQMDPIAAVVLLGIVTDAAALSLGGSAKLLLIRESFATGAIGVACFASLLLPRPLMFYFGRYFMASGDALKRSRFEASWALAEVRSGNRVVTLVWGIVFTGELALRVVMVYTMPPAAVLVLSPLVLGVLTVAGIVWSLAYATKLRRRVLPRLLVSARGGINPSAT